MYNCGLLNRKIEIWGKVKSFVLDEHGAITTIQRTDEIGQLLTHDAVLYTVWAEIIPQTGSLLSNRAADTILSKTTHKIKIRYRACFESLKSAENWLIYKGHRFNIDYILNPYFKNEFLEIFCNEVI